MSKEVMKLALSTLEGWANYDDWVWPESALEQAKRNTIEAITALRQALDTDKQWVGLTELERFAALVADHERDRICKAIKEEDDYCVTEGDYMLDSDDCIAIAKGDWVRPDYSATAIRGMR